MDKKINQKQGPRTGNAGRPEKREAFISEKSSTGSERSRIANMITDALGMRGRGQAGHTNPALEGVHSNTNTGPKKNSTADGSRLPKKSKR
jgi:hypothetical protein